MRKSLILVIMCAVAGCTHTRDVQKSTEEQPTFEEQIVKYEASFRPSDYDPQPSGKNGTSTPAATDSSAPTVLEPVNTDPEYVTGFRVQVFSSTIIDDARARKTELEALHPTEWVYLEYDPPAYKVRVGNFLSRFEADRFAKILIEEGYSDAWTVPGRVIKNPPPPNR